MATNPDIGPGYETTDVKVSIINKFLVGLYALMAFGIVVAVAVFALLQLRDTEIYEEMNPTVMQKTRQVPPAPLLQVQNQTDLDQYRAVEERKLHSYGWADKNAKVVRLPVERAIELVAERGLPVFEGDGEAAAAPQQPREGQ
jgi:hypothetical protein